MRTAPQERLVNAGDGLSACEQLARRIYVALDIAVADAAQGDRAMAAQFLRNNGMTFVAALVEQETMLPDRRAGG
jgi:hypothetical protein